MWKLIFLFGNRITSSGCLLCLVWQKKFGFNLRLFLRMMTPGRTITRLILARTNLLFFLRFTSIAIWHIYALYCSLCIEAKRNCQSFSTTNGNVFEDFHRLHPDACIQILLLSKFEDVYTSKDQFVEEIAFYVPLCVSIVTASSPVQLWWSS